MGKRGKHKHRLRAAAIAGEPVAAEIEVVEMLPQAAVEPAAEGQMSDGDVAGVLSGVTEQPQDSGQAGVLPFASGEQDGRSPFLVLADYEQRSLAHVVGLPEQLDAPGLWRGVAYRVGVHRLASGYDEVAEILPLPALTPVPGAAHWLLGVANIRGTLLPVVDLKQFLEGERTVMHERQRVLVVRQPGGDVAIIIDELYGQRSFIDAQGIEVATVAEGRYTHFVDRAYHMNGHDWGVFSLDRLARTPEFRQAAA